MSPQFPAGRDLIRTDIHYKKWLLPSLFENKLNKIVFLICKMDVYRETQTKHTYLALKKYVMKRYVGT